jgi:hypothetical protein
MENGLEESEHTIWKNDYHKKGRLGSCVSTECALGTQINAVENLRFEMPKIVQWWKMKLQGFTQRGSRIILKKKKGNNNLAHRKTRQKNFQHRKYRTPC